MRTDIDSLIKCVEDLNRYYQGTGIGLWLDCEEEDFGLDLRISGYTSKGDAKYGYVEVKGMSYTDEDFAEDGFLRVRACRNGSIRYGLTGDTKTRQADIEADRSPKPEWYYTKKALHVLNAADIKGGYENCKMAKIRGAGAYTIFMYEGGYLIYTAKDLERAIVGYVWMKLPHTKMLGDNRISWELKAVIDMDAPTRKITIEKY